MINVLNFPKVLLAATLLLGTGGYISEARADLCDLWLAELGINHNLKISSDQFRGDVEKAMKLSFPMGGIFGPEGRTPTTIDAIRIVKLEHTYSKSIDEIREALKPIMKHNAFDGETTPVSEALPVLELAYSQHVDPSAVYTQLVSIIKELPFEMGGIGGDAKREPNLNEASIIWQLMKALNKNIVEVKNDLTPLMQHGAFDGASVTIGESLPVLIEAYRESKSTRDLLVQYTHLEKDFSFGDDYEVGKAVPNWTESQRILRLVKKGKSIEEIKEALTPLMSSGGMYPVKITDALSVLEAAYQDHTLPENILEKIKLGQSQFGIRQAAFYGGELVLPSWSQMIRLFQVAQDRKEELSKLKTQFSEAKNLLDSHHKGTESELIDQIIAFLGADSSLAKN